MKSSVDDSVIIDQVKPSLFQRLEFVLETIDREDTEVMAFFMELGHILREATTESELLEFVVTLSTTAFRGFSFSENTIQAIDRLLIEAEEISAVFAASFDKKH